MPSVKCIQHGCQIAIQSFHDCGCAEEVLKSNNPCSLASVSCDGPLRALLDVTPDGGLLSGERTCHCLLFTLSVTLFAESMTGLVLRSAPQPSRAGPLVAEPARG